MKNHMFCDSHPIPADHVREESLLTTAWGSARSKPYGLVILCRILRPSVKYEATGTMKPLFFCYHRFPLFERVARMIMVTQS